MKGLAFLSHLSATVLQNHSEGGQRARLADLVFHAFLKLAPSVAIS